MPPLALIAASRRLWGLDWSCLRRIWNRCLWLPPLRGVAGIEVGCFDFVALNIYPRPELGQAKVTVRNINC